MGDRDRFIRDQLFDDGFAKMARGEYAEGIETLQVASGAEDFPANPYDDYSVETGISWIAPVYKAARGARDQAVSPAALVFMGSESEFKGFIERRTGTSPDYRIPGYANHLGQAIQYYRKAEAMRYPVASERLEALRLKLGSDDFNNAERTWNDAQQRGQEYMRERVAETRRAMGLQPDPAPANKQSGCYIATAVYGSYDCEEVWVLRRWRDSVLAHSTAGRAFIRLYYATSPRIVDSIGQRAWFRATTKLPLDRFVVALRRAGFSSRPYSD